MKLRPATMADADLLLAWRNDDLTRENSRNTGIVDRAEHVSWLARRIEAGTAPLIAEIDNVPVGTVRLDHGADGTEISWTIAPDKRGRGLGYRMVELATALVSGPAVAEIKPRNIASQRIAKATGFENAGDRGGLQLWIRVANTRAP